MHAVNLTAAAIFRKIGGDRPPTLLMDEADTYLGPRVADRHEEIRALVNAGHRRGAVAYRCVGEPAKMVVQEFPAFAAVALAGIGDLPDTIIDRSIVIRMKRRAPSEPVQGFRQRDAQPLLATLRARLEAWTEARAVELRAARPEMPDGIVDRAADVWEPLIAIAEAAGGDWPERAREAAVELNAARRRSDPSLGVQLLTDIRHIFETRRIDRISSEDLIGALCDLDESPWGDLRGKPIDARGVARRLRKFDVSPHVVRIGDQTPRGYERTDLHDAWLRYLPALLPPDSATSATNETVQVRAPSSVADAGHVADTSATRNLSATDSRPLTRNVASVALVADPGQRETGEGPPKKDWSYGHPLEPCEVCHEPCEARTLEGRVVHPTCPVEE